MVDVAIDQGGCFETSHPTTHADPTFVIDGIIHYCVANMPGAAPLTSTYALGAATAPYLRALANKGVDQALAEDPGFAMGVNVRFGRITHLAVKDALRLG
jgi:alanine dehydrogenase